MNRDSRAGVLAALREIYDGAWTRHVGTDGGRELHWEGKLGLVGGVTPIIDSHHGVMASMGERFLLFRLPQSDPELQALRAMENQRHIGRMTRDLAEAVRGLFAGGLDPERPERTSMGEVGRLVALATIAAQARSAVERDGRTREVELVPDAEMPARLTVGLAQLDDGMAAIGVPAGDRWRHVCKVALDCIPSIRRRILARLIEHGTAMSTADIAEALDYPTTTARRALEDLTCHHVLMRVKTGQGGADLWTVGKVTLERWESAGVPVGILGTVPEMSEVAA